MKISLIINLLLAAVILIGLAMSSYAFFLLHTGYHQINNHHISNIEAAADITPQETTPSSVDPERLIIPSIGVNALVEKIGLTTQGAVGVPAGPFDVAWFDVGPLPGEEGSAVISGHYGPWKDGAQSVFDNLSKVNIGDKIYVQDSQGNRITFIVTGSQVYNLNDIVPAIFNKTGGSYLNLITCNGDWIADQKTYDKRLVVFTQEE